MLTTHLNPFMTLPLCRAFSVSPNKAEARYTRDGVVNTRSSVSGVLPEDRTIFQWSILMDWDLQRRRPYVIVDPLDPTGLLYLNHAEYLSHSKVCASTDLALVTIARPGSKPPVPDAESSDSSSQNSPPKGRQKGENEFGRDTRYSWKTLLKLRASVAKIVNRKTGSAMVSETTDSVVRSVLVWTRQLAHYAELRNPETYGQLMVPLVSHLQKLLTNNGQMAVVQHLKLSLFALYSFISGNPLSSTTALGWGIRLRTCGLPRVWHSDLVRYLKRGDIGLIRLMASLLNLYRAMEAPHPDFSVATITKPHPDFGSNTDFAEFSKFCQETLPALLKWEMKHGGHPTNLDFKYHSARDLIICSAGANLSGPAMQSIVQDAKAWQNQPANHALEWFDMHGDEFMSRLLKELATEAHGPSIFIESAAPGFNQSIYESMGEEGRKQYLAMFNPVKREVHNLSSMSKAFMATRQPHFKDKKFFEGSLDGFAKPILGRLHAIDEPAGKVRVVAICDYFSQVAFKPVHDHLFSILRRIRQDATFDQTGITERYFQKGLSPHWSFDLKSATDLIPLSLYREVLGTLLISKGDTPEHTRARVDLWCKIATDRDFLTPDGLTTVRYGTGQPMGVLSSWASMALVHHALVQYSAWKQGVIERSWYQDYLVLGDDIDIARSKSVADGYRSACESFQIVIGLAKSLQSDKNCFEFANQRYCPEGNISPLSFKEELQAQSWTGRVEYARRILARFGTSIKDEAMALLSKVSTAGQWRATTPERSGDRSPLILNLFRFCCLNPFNQGGTRLDGILSWLAPVLREEDRAKLVQLLASTEKKEEMSKIIAQRLLVELLSLARKQLARIPKPYQVKDCDPGNRKAILDEVGRSVALGNLGSWGSTGDGGATRFRRFSIGDLQPSRAREPSAPPNSEIGILYVMNCVAVQNDKLKRDLKKLIEQLEAMDRPMALTMDMKYHAMAPDIYPDPLVKIISLWSEIVSLPHPIVPDFTVGMSKWLGVDETLTPLSKLFDKKTGRYLDRVLEERIRGPMTSVALGCAEVLGLTIPPIPYHVSRTGGPWRRNLKIALAKFEAGREVSLSFELFEALFERAPPSALTSE